MMAALDEMRERNAKDTEDLKKLFSDPAEIAAWERIIERRRSYMRAMGLIG